MIGGLGLTARAAVVIAALGSITLMFYGGRHNPSAFLLILFALWDVSPFIGLALARRQSERWPAGGQLTLYLVMLLIAIGSLAIYVNAVFISPPAKLAAPFLIVPLVSWAVLLIVVLVVVFRRRSQPPVL